MISIPAKTVYPRRNAKHIPDRPPGGYHVTSNEQPTYSVDGDHGPTTSQLIADLNDLDDAMLVIERKAETLIRKLSDPALFDQWPADHPVRIEAEDRLSDHLKALQVHRFEVNRIAAEIHARGSYLFLAGNEHLLDRYGESMVRDSGALGRVQQDVPGLMTGQTWQRLFDVACPF